MKTAGCLTFVYFLIAVALGSLGAASLREQEYVRDSEPKLFSYDELVQLSLDQEMSPELAEKLRLIKTPSAPVRQVAVFSFPAPHEAQW